MPILSTLTPARLTEEAATRAAEFPSSRFGCGLDINRQLLDDFHDALADGGEEIMQKCLTAHPYLIQYALKNTGHHGIWVFPKQMIRTTAVDRSPGMIPHFLVAGKSSLGLYWFVVEIKRPATQFSNRKGDGFSSEGSRAVGQCNSYLDHFSNYIETIRNNARLPEIIRPQGAVLIMGRSERETDRQRAFRRKYVDTTSKVDVVSYDRSRRGVLSDLGESA